MDRPGHRFCERRILREIGSAEMNRWISRFCYVIMWLLKNMLSGDQQVQTTGTI